MTGLLFKRKTILIDSSNPDIILSVRDLSKSFPGVRALNKISMDIRRGEIHVVMGENGAGKSTLMKILAGVYSPDEGEIFLEEKQIKVENPLKAQHLGINLIYQELSIAANLTVAENIFMGSEPSKFGLVDRKTMVKRSNEILELLGSRIPVSIIAGKLSIAEQQQIEIARALGHNSKILIMDEPTAALSDNETDHLFKLILSLREKGLAIIYISHRLAEVEKIADRVSVLRDGEYIGTLDKKDIDNAAIVKMMVGRSLTDFYKHEVSSEKIDDYFIVENISDGKGKVKNVSFKASAGEILAISGLVGSGRTELARLIFGIDKSSSGTIYLDGKVIITKNPGDAIRHGIGYVPEDRRSQGLFLEMSSGENISMNIIGRTAKWGILADKENNKLVEKSINQLNIKLASHKAKALSLSGGNQQKLLLSRWLQIEPRVLILDEPTRGVDVGAKSEIYKLIGEVAGKGVAVIFISSELPEVVGVAQRVLVMREGRIVAELKDKKDINQETIMAFATGIKNYNPSV